MQFEGFAKVVGGLLRVAQILECVLGGALLFAQVLEGLVVDSCLRTGFFPVPHFCSKH